eukprot:3941537-Rhodomonas_salina.4
MHHGAQAAMIVSQHRHRQRIADDQRRPGSLRMLPRRRCLCPPWVTLGSEGGVCELHSRPPPPLPPCPALPISK